MGLLKSLRRRWVRKFGSEILGLRSPPKVYGHSVETFNLDHDGVVEFAQWLHPSCLRTIISQAAVNELRRYVQPGDAIIDVGAHSGDTSVLFALAAGAGGRVFAVEPNRYVLPVLEVNANLNPRAAPIVVLPYAATIATMPLVFNYSDAGFCNGGDLSGTGFLRSGHLYPLDVEGRNIADELASTAPEWLGKVRLIKTDTEGNDQSVIESLVDVIRATRPYLISEIYILSTESQRRDFHKLLTQDLGYRVFRSEPYTQLRAEQLSGDDMMRFKHFDIFCVPNN